MALLLTTVAGCSKDMMDLQAYVGEVKARKPSGIEPIPEPKPYQKFEYVDAGRRDPFDSSVIARPEAHAKSKADLSVSPDPNRPPEFLESFPLDTLRMVGTLQQENSLWALIKTPDGTIQRVTTGNHLGQNYGMIDKIAENEIEMTEIIPDGFGGWKERGQSVALSE